MTRTVLALAATAVFLGACATADPYNVAVATDREVTEAEFMAGVDTYGAFNYWDANGDGYMSAAEFEAGMRSVGLTAPHGFETWDTNNDGRLSESEFYRGTYRDLAEANRGVVTERAIAENRYLIAW